MTWSFPLYPQDLTNLVRLTSEYGVFHHKRSYYFHQGVDLYVTGNAPVMAVEDGEVVAIVDFTGPPDHPHWEYTQAVLVSGASGVVCYGEVQPKRWIKVGQRVEEGEKLANVMPVIPKGMERPDIFGHSRYMLHFELYTHGTTEPVSWHHLVRPDDCLGDGGCAECRADIGSEHALTCQEKPVNLLDPTGPLTASWRRMLRI